MAMEKKVKTAEEKAFNKRWGKKTKLNPCLKTLRRDVGKAPKCGVREKTVAVATPTTNKKKR